VYSELAFSPFHFWQPWLIASKNGLSSPFTTITSSFFCAIAVEAESAMAAPAHSKRIFFILFLPGIRRC
jgi:hypothetical protein